ncbi:MAG: hypothetical protein RR540_03055 [Oscillospiraceae bacterium]
MTILVYSLTGISHNQPISYYATIFTILSIALGFSFFSVLIGSGLASYRLKGNCSATFVEVTNDKVIVSVFKQKWGFGKKADIYKTLYVADLKAISDIYFYNKKLVIIAAARAISTKSHWLSYHTDERDNFHFDRWWYDANGGKSISHIIIPDVFFSGERIAKTIQVSSGKAKEMALKHKEFREHMLAIANRRT